MCTFVRDPSVVTRRKLGTSDYSVQARKTLGDAVAASRMAAGWRSRQALADVAKVSLRSVHKLEVGDPGVGEKILLAVARALPRWTIETPRTILEGGPVPPPLHVGPGQDPVEAEIFEKAPADVGSDEWLEWYRQRLLPEHFSEVFRVTMQLRAKVAEVDEIRRMLAESVRPT